MTSVGLISCVISHPSVELGFVAAETSSGKILFQMPHFKRNKEEARQRRQAHNCVCGRPREGRRSIRRTSGALWELQGQRGRSLNSG